MNWGCEVKLYEDRNTGPFLLAVCVVKEPGVIDQTGLKLDYCGIITECRLEFVWRSVPVWVREDDPF